MENKADVIYVSAYSVYRMIDIVSDKPRPPSEVVGELVQEFTGKPPRRPVPGREHRSMTTVLTPTLFGTTVLSFKNGDKPIEYYLDKSDVIRYFQRNVKRYGCLPFVSYLCDERTSTVLKRLHTWSSLRGAVLRDRSLHSVDIKVNHPKDELFTLQELWDLIAPMTEPTSLADMKLEVFRLIHADDTITEESHQQLIWETLSDKDEHTYKATTGNFLTTRTGLSSFKEDTNYQVTVCIDRTHLVTLIAHLFKEHGV